MTRELFLIIASMALTLGVTSTSWADKPMALDDVLREAATRPAASAAHDQARGASAAADAERRQALLPSIQIRGSAEARSKALTLTLPMATLEVGDRRRFAAHVAVRQPVLDAARLFYTAPAARKAARAASLSATRVGEVYAARAGSLYFDVLELDARAAALGAHVSSLERRLAELESLVSEGRAIERDRLRLRLALDDARLSRDTLMRDRAVTALALGHAIGRDRPVEPAPLSRPLEPGRRETRRADVRALEVERAAVMQRRAGVAAELIPAVTLEGAWIYDDSLLADQDSFFAVTLNLSWTPLASGTRPARRRALSAQASALRLQRIELQRQVELEDRAAASALRSASEALAVAERGVADADEARRVTLARYQAGRETISEVLDVEALVRDRQTARVVATIAVSRAVLAARLARGGALGEGD